MKPDPARPDLDGSPGDLANSLMDQVVARARRQLDRLRDLGDRVSGIEVSESSPDGAVTVTVNGSGALVDLRLSSAVNRWTPEEFDDAVVGTARRAAALAFAQHADLINEFNEESAKSIDDGDVL